MERYRLKMIMILILLLVNGFFLGYHVREILARRSAQRHIEEQLTVLFAADGIALRPGAISHARPRDCVRLPEDSRWEGELADFFSSALSPALSPSPEDAAARTADEAADREAYPLVRCYPNGDFTVGEMTVPEGAADLFRRFCRVWSFQIVDAGGTDDSDLDAGGTDSGEFSAIARYAGAPVVNCRVWFSCDGDVLRRAAGTILPRRGTAAALDPAALAAVQALAIFQSAQQEKREVLSEITGVTACYELTRDARGLLLEPCWQVETDTLVYYVNGVTGAVSAA